MKWFVCTLKQSASLAARFKKTKEELHQKLASKNVSEMFETSSSEEESNQPDDAITEEDEENITAESGTDKIPATLPKRRRNANHHALFNVQTTLLEKSSDSSTSSSEELSPLTSPELSTPEIERKDLKEAPNFEVYKENQRMKMAKTRKRRMAVDDGIFREEPKTMQELPTVSHRPVKEFQTASKKPTENVTKRKSISIPRAKPAILQKSIKPSGRKASVSIEISDNFVPLNDRRKSIKPKMLEANRHEADYSLNERRKSVIPLAETAGIIKKQDKETWDLLYHFCENFPMLKVYQM